MKGIHEFDFDGKKRGFKFGTYAMAIAQKRSGAKGVVELLSKLQAGGGDFMTLLDLFYGAAENYAEHKKIPVDFTMSDVSDWVDEMGFEKAALMINEMLSQYNPKNSTPPVNPGENPK